MCLGTIGRAVRVWDEGGVPMAHVESSGRSAAACLLYHPEVEVGDHVLVHMGFVVAVLDDRLADDARNLRAGMVPPGVDA